MKQILLILTVACVFAVGVHANPCEGQADGRFVTNPDGDCQDYFVCYDGVANPRRCPTGFFFDEPLQLCNFWDVVLCGDINDPCYGKPQFSFIDRPTGTCSSYYRCEYGVGIPLDCPEGFYFDELNQMCNFPDQVECEDSVKPTPPTPPGTPGTTPEQTAPTPAPTVPAF